MKTIIAKTFTASILVTLLLTSCGGGPMPVTQSKVGDAALSEQSVDAVVWFATSAENDYIYRQSYSLARHMVETNMKTSNSDMPKAVVLDLDETVLDNSPYSINLIKNGEVYKEASWAEWVGKAEAKLMPGVLDFLRYCENLNIEIFYISNRSDAYLNATMQNLVNKEVPFADPEHIFLKAEESDKTNRRERIKSRYDVLLYVGDNLLDFDERFRDRSVLYGKRTVQDLADEMLSHHLLLPNPMYGQWEKAFDYGQGASSEQKAKIKVQQTIGAE